MPCVCAGAAQEHGAGDGPEDEHHGQQQSQHAEGGAAHEPPPTSQHPQVCVSVSLSLFLSFFLSLFLSLFLFFSVTGQTHVEAVCEIGRAHV